MELKTVKKIGLLALACVVFACANKKTPVASKTTKAPKFEANWESIKKNYKDPAWFNAAKFGIFS